MNGKIILHQYNISYIYLVFYLFLGQQLQYPRGPERESMYITFLSDLISSRRIYSLGQKNQLRSPYANNLNSDPVQEQFSKLRSFNFWFLLMAIAIYGVHLRHALPRKHFVQLEVSRLYWFVPQDMGYFSTILSNTRMYWINVPLSLILGQILNSNFGSKTKSKICFLNWIQLD